MILRVLLAVGVVVIGAAQLLASVVVALDHSSAFVDDAIGGDQETDTVAEQAVAAVGAVGKVLVVGAVGTVTIVGAGIAAGRAAA